MIDRDLRSYVRNPTCDLKSRERTYRSVNLGFSATVIRATTYLGLSGRARLLVQFSSRKPSNSCPCRGEISTNFREISPARSRTLTLLPSNVSVLKLRTEVNSNAASTFRREIDYARCANTCHTLPVAPANTYTRETVRDMATWVIHYTCVDAVAEVSWRRRPV